MNYKITEDDWNDLKRLREEYNRPYHPSLSAEQKEFLEEYYMLIPRKERGIYIKKFFPDYKSKSDSFHRNVWNWHKKGYICVQGM